MTEGLDIRRVFVMLIAAVASVSFAYEAYHAVFWLVTITTWLLLLEILEKK